MDDSITMSGFIKAKLSQVLSDFEERVARCKRLCKLKTLTYETGGLPDYKDPFIQQYYILRYFPAYLYEYYLIYRRILAKRLVDKPLNILSIGAGCGLDYYGLHFALREGPGHFAHRLCYTGVDLVAWAYRENLGRKQIRFLKHDIQNWELLDDKSYNIIIFPKSLGEFPPLILSRIQNLFRKSNFERGKVCLACSLIGKADKDRFADVVKVMTDHHSYACKDEPVVFGFRENKRIDGLRKDWAYPQDALRFLEALPQQCQTRRRNKRPCEDDCNDLLKQYPILRTTYVKYQVIGLE